MTIKKASKKLVDQLYYKDEQRRLTKLVSGFSFDMFIMLIILADAIVLGLQTSPTMEYYFENGLFLLDRVFMGIFMAEMFLKILALKKKFFELGWNIFDLTIVAVSLVPFMSAFIILRTFRLFRLLKYVDHFSKMNNLIQVFIKLLPSFISFMVVFAIFFYVFAIIAVDLFGESFTIFSCLGNAMFTLLQIFTLDGWASTIARPIMTLYPHAWMYFASVLLFSFLLTLSFIVSAIVQIAEILRK
ncbi:MAG: ion transporter [Alphaproteobacteria bacterium]|nr:ion transporter [Alphaproteobacteria bacterium]